MQGIKRLTPLRTILIAYVGLCFQKLCIVSDNTNTIPSIVEHMEMQFDFQTPRIHWGHNYFLRVLLKNGNRKQILSFSFEETFGVFSNMRDVASYSSIWYVTKRYKLFCPNTHHWDTAICINVLT